MTEMSDHAETRGEVVPDAEPDVAFYTLEEAVPGIRDNYATHVYLKGSRIGRVGMSTVATALAAARSAGREKNTSLTLFQISMNSLSCEAAADISAILEHCVSLQTLELGLNNLSEAGAMLIAPALSRSLSLQNLYLTNNKIGAFGTVVMGAALKLHPSLKTLDLDACNIRDCGASAIAVVLAYNKSLQRLYLENNGISCLGSTKIAVSLERNTTLRELSLASNSIGESGSIHSSKAIASLVYLTSLRVLCLSRCKLGDISATAIGMALAHNTSLRVLQLNDNQISSAGLVTFKFGLAKNNGLHRLGLHSNQIDDDGAKAIGGALAYNASLQMLDLDNNRIGDGGATAVGNGLKHNKSLRELDLSNNMIGDDGAGTIGKALVHNSSLEILFLEKNRIGDDGAMAIGGGLEQNKALRSLHLGGSWDNTQSNMIGGTGAAALFKTLKSNTALEIIDLSYCPIRTLGTEFLWTGGLKSCKLELRNLLWPPPAITKRGYAAVYSFFEAVKARSAPLTRSRVMLVGAGGTGKTTLKTALLLRGANARATLQQLQRSMIETIELRWTETDLREWVNADLAHEVDFFQSCPKAKGLNGKRWLKLSAPDLARIFGHPDTATSKDVVSKMLAVLGFLKPETAKTAAQDTTADIWWWWDEMVESLARSTAALEGFEWPSDEVVVPDGDSAETEVPYGVLLNIPHVWTEGVELDTRWEEYTLWDFPGQMELYPSHQLFLACETAVYVLVVNGRLGDLDECTRPLYRWLSLIRSGTSYAWRDSGGKVEVRIVVTHTDVLFSDRRDALLRDLHQELVANSGIHFGFGEKCYATVYNRADGGDVDELRADLAGLRSVLRPNLLMPAIYQAICDDVVIMAREKARWPIVSISDIDWRGQPEALEFLEGLGFLRRADADNKVILEPVTWLSTLMSAFLHPFHGIGSRCSPPIPEPASAATLKQHHITSVLVDCGLACQIINMRSKLIQPEHEKDVLPLLARFDVCFSPLNDGKYVFPSLLPRVTSVPSWLTRPLNGNCEGRRYVCRGAYDYIPPMLGTLLVRRMSAMGCRLGGEPMFFGRGTIVIGCPDRSGFAIHVTDDDRAIDVIAFGPNYHSHLSAATLHLAVVLWTKFRACIVDKYRLKTMPSSTMADPFVQPSCHHPLLGRCTITPVRTAVRRGPRTILEWFADKRREIQGFPDWQSTFAWGWIAPLELKDGWIQLLVDTSIVEETWAGIDANPTATAPAARHDPLSENLGPVVMVVSCPHTMSLTNTAPFRPVDNVTIFDVFAYCETLQAAGRIRMAYDRPGTTTKSDRDCDLIWSLGDPRLDGKSEDEKWQAVRESVATSTWFYGFQTSVKAQIRQVAQAHPGRRIRLVCIQGGPITEIEHEYMSKIVTEGRRDAAVFGLSDLRVDIAMHTFRDFYEEFPLEPLQPAAAAPLREDAL